MVFLYAAVSLGTVPSSDVLKGLLPFEAGGSTGEEVGETLAVRAAKQASSLMALLSSQASMKAQKVWLGEGLGSVPKRTYKKAIS